VEFPESGGPGFEDAISTLSSDKPPPSTFVGLNWHYGVGLGWRIGISAPRRLPRPLLLALAARAGGERLKLLPNSPASRTTTAPMPPPCSLGARATRDSSSAGFVLARRAPDQGHSRTSRQGPVDSHHEDFQGANRPISGTLPHPPSSLVTWRSAEGSRAHRARGGGRQMSIHRRLMAPAVSASEITRAGRSWRCAMSGSMPSRLAPHRAEQVRSGHGRGA